MIRPLRLTTAVALAILAPASWVSRPVRAWEAPDGHPAAAQAVTITVHPGARQTFAGMGTSQHNFNRPYGKLSPERRALLARLTFHELRIRTLRLWWNPGEYAPRPGDRNMAPFVDAYLTSNLLADARANGVTMLLLGPERVPPYMLEDPGKGDSPIKASEIGNYAALIADFIARLRDVHGIRIGATGVANEPPWFTPETMVATVKALRAELDGRRLHQVAIVAPEHANNDAKADQFLAALKADAGAWAALSGLATHTYNMGARDEEASLLGGPAGPNLKEFWITESGGGAALPTSEPLGDARQAASMASRFLSDMNHRVTHWVWFLGAEEVLKWPEDFDNVQRLIQYQPLRAGDWYLPLLKYYYLRRLSLTFDPSAAFRDSRSSLEADMTWTYGRKPRLTAAAALNPDGSWAIGLSNYTSDRFEFPGMTPFDRDNTGHAAQVFNVTLRVPDLAGAGPVEFRVHRSGEALRDIDEGTVTMRGGVVMVPDVSSLQLVTLRSAAPQPAPGRRRPE